jgi:serine/threonine protein kinase
MPDPMACFKVNIIHPRDLKVNWWDKSWNDGGITHVESVTYQGESLVLKQRLTRDAKKSIQKEAFVLASLEHPNIIKLFGILGGRKLKQFGLITEMCNAGNFKQYLANPRDIHATPAEAIGILDDAMHALAYLHPLGLIHQRVNPTHILVDKRDGKTSGKLCGFRFTTSCAIDEHKNCNKSRYRAPEIKKGHPYGVKVDVYSLGIVHLDLIETFGMTLTLWMFNMSQQNPDHRSSIADVLREKEEQKESTKEMLRRVGCYENQGIAMKTAEVQSPTQVLEGTQMAEESVVNVNGSNRQ